MFLPVNKFLDPTDPANQPKMKRHPGNSNSKPRKRTKNQHSAPAIQTNSGATPIAEDKSSTINTAGSKIETTPSVKDSPFIDPRAIKKTVSELDFFSGEDVFTALDTNSELNNNANLFINLLTNIETILPITSKPKPSFLSLRNPATAATPTSTAKDTPRASRTVSTPLSRTCKRCKNAKYLCLCASGTLYAPGGFSAEDWDNDDFAAEELPDWIIPLEVPVTKCLHCGLWASDGYFSCLATRKLSES